MGEGRREGVGLRAPAVLGEEKERSRRMETAERAFFSLRSVPVHSPPGIPALTLGMPRVHLPVVQRQGRDAQAWGRGPGGRGDRRGLEEPCERKWLLNPSGGGEAGAAEAGAGPRRARRGVESGAPARRARGADAQ